MSNDIRAEMQGAIKTAQPALSNAAFGVLIGGIVCIGLGIGAVLSMMPLKPKAPSAKVAQSPLPATFPAITPSLDGPTRQEREDRARDWVKQAGLPGGEDRFEQMNLYLRTTGTLRACSVRDSHKHLRRVHDAYRDRNQAKFEAWQALRESHGETMAKMQDMNQVELALSLASGAPQRAAMETYAEFDMMLSATP
ncbi:MAG: hypothetical protein AAFY82_06715, partial [Pseudomonadota bacterium]